MTGIPTVNRSPLFLYELLASACIAGFAAYDLKKRRVPDRALLLFLPFALMAPLVRTRLLGTALLLPFVPFLFYRGSSRLSGLTFCRNDIKRRCRDWGRGYQAGRSDGVYLWPFPYAGHPSHCFRPCRLYFPGSRAEAERGAVLPPLCAVPDGREPGRYPGGVFLTVRLLHGRQQAVHTYRIGVKITMKLNNRFIFGLLSILLAAVIAFVALS